MIRLFVEGDLADIRQVRDLPGVYSLGGRLRNAGEGRYRVAVTVDDATSIPLIAQHRTAVTVISTPKAVVPPAQPVNLYGDAGAISRTLETLSSAHSDIASFVELAKPTHKSQKLASFRLGAETAPVKVLITAGFHGREWPPPRAVVTCIQKLLAAYDAAGQHHPIQLGGFTLTCDELKAIFEKLYVVFVPLVNPDGYDVSLNGTTRRKKSWRKNWSPPPSLSLCHGVDLNRNFAVAWDATMHYTDDYRASRNAPKTRPCSDTYIGSSAFSEPESSNIFALALEIDFNYALDCHCDGQNVMYPWAVARTQTSDLTKSFDATKGTKAWDDTYRLYLPPADEKKFREIGKDMCDAIRRATNVAYTLTDVVKAVGYCCPGSSMDYLYKEEGVCAMAAEFGPGTTGSQPTNVKAIDKIEREVNAAVLSFLKYAATK